MVSRLITGSKASDAYGNGISLKYSIAYSLDDLSAKVTKNHQSFLIIGEKVVLLQKKGFIMKQINDLMPLATLEDLREFCLDYARKDK